MKAHIIRFANAVGLAAWFESRDFTIRHCDHSADIPPKPVLVLLLALLAPKIPPPELLLLEPKPVFAG